MSSWHITRPQIILDAIIWFKWKYLTLKNIHRWNNESNWARKVCEMILFIGGPVDWWVEAGAWETWMGGHLGYRGRGCVTLLSLLRVWIRKRKRSDDGRTYRRTNRISTCRLDLCKGLSKRIDLHLPKSLLSTSSTKISQIPLLNLWGLRKNYNFFFRNCFQYYQQNQRLKWRKLQV